MPDTKLYNPSRDKRHNSFVVNLNNQDFELALLSITADNKMYFYTIFKPTEYDHVIYMSTISSSWAESVASLVQIFYEVCNHYGVDPKQFTEINSFISSQR